MKKTALDARLDELFDVVAATWTLKELFEQRIPANGPERAKRAFRHADEALLATPVPPLPRPSLPCPPSLRS